MGALAKNKAAEAAGKAGAKENTPKKPQLSACEQCKAKCQSGACKQWCHTHWCDSAAKQPSDAPQPEAAPASQENAQEADEKKEEVAQDEKKEADDIEKAIQDGGDEKDMKKAMDDSKAVDKDEEMASKAE